MIAIWFLGLGVFGLGLIVGYTIGRTSIEIDRRASNDTITE